MNDFDRAFADTFHQVAYWGQIAAENEAANAVERGRPFVLLKPSMGRDGNQWCALYGPNLMEGVAGFGDSPDEASRDFDRNWSAKLPPKGGS